MASPNLTSKLLSERWNIRPATLRQWRWNDRGPKFFKAGECVLYKIKEVEKFEEQADFIYEMFIIIIFYLVEQGIFLKTGEKNGVTKLNK